MKFNVSIFKPYDVRGIYPKELDGKTAYAVGRAFARRANAPEIIVGSDMRLSSPMLKKQLVKGITDEGVNIIDIGLVPIDAVYFAVHILNYPAGIMVTASHNPKEYNGFKMPLKDGWVRGEDLYEDVQNLPTETATKKGKIKQIDLMPQYIKHILSFCDLNKIKPFKVVIDAGNGMAGKVIPLLKKHLSIKIIPLNFKLDGNFPAHPSNPLLLESQVQIKNAIKEHQADFGIILDGDTDRLFFVDEKSEFIRADLTLLILAKEFLNREPGAKIVYNVICSRVVPKKIKEWGGKPIRAKVGYANIMEAMKENDAIMGGELSAHYAFRDSGYTDSGFIAFMILLQLLSQENRPLSKIVDEFKEYYKSDEVNIEIADRENAIAKIKKRYTGGQQDELDGLTVSYKNWWLNVRKSNTEPLLRITVEGPDKNFVEEKIAEILKIVK